MSRAGRHVEPGGRREDSAERRMASLVPAGWKLLICISLSALAFGARAAELLAGLVVVELLLGLAFCPLGRMPWRDGARLLGWQTGIIVGLYLFRSGAAGLWPGLRTSGQLFLAFWPGMVFVQSVPAAEIARTLGRLMPYRTAFVLSTSMRFMPLMIRELKSIHEVQVLRGAKILPRDLLRPWNWPDLVHCVLVPAIIQSLALAAEIAQAASARDFGCGDSRTHWPGS
jgi:energy-coupling factor transport system permease protein